MSAPVKAAEPAAEAALRAFPAVAVASAARAVPDGIAGRVVGHREGFGFLIRDDGGPDAVLPEGEMRKVLHGDRVLIRLAGTDRRGRPEGEIVEVLERCTTRLVGRFLQERGSSIVVPEDQRVRHDILIPAAATMGSRHGQVVVIEIVQQPARHVQPVGRVIEVLGEIDDPGMEITIAVRKYGVPHEFPAAALAEAEAYPTRVRPSDLKGRVDLRDVSLVTIDGEDARDFDDAIYCEPMPGRGKGWRLLVAIADVSHYVRPGSALDAEAALRSTSVYFPRRVIPMLPEALSNGLCSLNPQVDRLVLVCDMVISAKGEVRAYQIYSAVMHSRARLTYDQVWEALSVPGSKAATQCAAVLPQLRHAHALYEALAAARRERGAIDLETTETRIVCDAAGKIERIVPRQRNDAHKVIEECMLAANVSTADFLLRHKHPCLFRVHEGPTPTKLANLRALLKNLGLVLEGGDEPTPADYSRLAAKIRARVDAKLLDSVLLRSMQQAVYSPHNGGHFGLAYAAYTHFTSPIRRYPDLMVHRALKAILAGRRYEPPAAGDDPAEALVRWERLGMLCSANERRADEATRDVEAWLKSYYMRERVGETFAGTISAVVPFGLFVVLDDLYVEGLVHISELGGEYFAYNEALHELRGERTGLRYRLTDRLTVQVARVDLEARRIDFRLVRDGRRELVAKAQEMGKGPSKPGATMKKGAAQAPAPAAAGAGGVHAVRAAETAGRPAGKRRGEGVEERKARQRKRAERVAARSGRGSPAGGASRGKRRAG